MAATESGQVKASANEQSESPWATALNQLRKWDREWAAQACSLGVAILGEGLGRGAAA